MKIFGLTKNNRLKGLLILFFIAGGNAGAETLTVTPEDIRIEQSLEGGYHLWIRQKEGMESVLLTESTEDPQRESATFALRAVEKNPFNGDEKRMLDGEFLDPEKKLFSLIDSTPEEHPELGSAFHIFIPYVVVYGYPWSRQGELLVVDGTYLSIRAFGSPYGDYAGGFRDNPFILRVVQKPLPGPPAENYREDTRASYGEIASANDGSMVHSLGEGDILNNIGNLIPGGGDSLDLVLALDTTASMENDIPFLKESLVDLLKEETAGYRSFRIGLVLYRDYHDEYITRIKPFTADYGLFQRELNRITVFGGRDIPEAVHEALYEAIRGFSWMADDRKIILIGDAPPHERPRGEVTKEMVDREAASLGIEIDTIILPQ